VSGLDCEQVSAANLLGRAEKFATAQRNKPRSSSQKKLMAGPQFGRRGLSADRWSNTGLASAVGRGILFLSPAKKVHNVLAFLPRHLVHNQIFTPFFRPAPGLHPCSGLTSALSGTG